MNPITVESYQCSNCSKLYQSLELTESCCKKGVCETCGGETYGVYQKNCYDCQLKNAFATAQEVDTYEGMLYCPYSEKFFDSEEEFLEFTYCDEKPPWKPGDHELFCTKTIVWEPSVIDEDSIQDDLDNQGMHEDAFEEITDLDELLDFFKQWSKKQNVVSYDEDRSRKVVITKAMVQKWKEENL